MTQKDVFLESEGDAWYRRNKVELESRDWSLDPVCVKTKQLIDASGGGRILEIGCGDGSRLRYLSKCTASAVFSGVDPSGEAITRALGNNVNAYKATADNLPFEDDTFDIVIFGFCLYLSDDMDLFRIAQEADRVLAKTGWLLILDFESRSPTYCIYRHRDGIYTRKMSYKDMFLWHPAYTLASHEKFHHLTRNWTDDPDEWVSLACLRKVSRE